MRIILARANEREAVGDRQQFVAGLDFRRAEATLEAARTTLATIDAVADAASAQRREVELLEGRVAAVDASLTTKRDRMGHDILRK